MRIAKLFAASCLLAVSAAPALAQTMSSADYVKKAGASDMYERESSKLVTTSKNPQVKSFAQMMITDHAKSTAMVKSAAMKSKVRVAPPMLTPDKAQMVAELRAAKGADRDTLYITQQKAAHQEALMLHQDEAANGTAAPLKMAAGNIVPVVQHHIEMLNGM